MNRHGIAAALLALAGLQIAAPPYYGAVADSGGRLHASLGHYPRWASPTPEVVCSAIRASQEQAHATPLVECPPSADRRLLFRARVNVIRLSAETAAAVIVCLAVALATGGGRRNRPRAKARPHVTGRAR